MSRHCSANGVLADYAIVCIWLIASSVAFMASSPLCIVNESNGKQGLAGNRKDRAKAPPYVSVHYLHSIQALQIARFRHIQQDWMVFRRSPALDQAQVFGRRGGVGDHSQEVRGADVEGAGQVTRIPPGRSISYRAQLSSL